METKYNFDILDFIIIFNGTCVSPQVAASRCGIGFPLKLHREFVFQGFHVHNVRIVVYKVALYCYLTVIYT
jgi:hypothetical protein